MCIWYTGNDLIIFSISTLIETESRECKNSVLFQSDFVQFLPGRIHSFKILKISGIALLRHRFYDMSLHPRKSTLWSLRKVSTRMSLSMPRRLTRIENSRQLWIFWFRSQYSIPLFPWDGMCRPGSVCADCAGWSESIHYAETTMLVFSDAGSYHKTGALVMLSLKS